MRELSSMEIECVGGGEIVRLDSGGIKVEPQPEFLELNPPAVNGAGVSETATTIVRIL